MLCSLVLFSLIMSSVLIVMSAGLHYLRLGDAQIQNACLTNFEFFEHCLTSFQCFCSFLQFLPFFKCQLYPSAVLNWIFKSYHMNSKSAVCSIFAQDAVSFFNPLLTRGYYQVL